METGKVTSSHKEKADAERLKGLKGQVKKIAPNIRMTSLCMIEKPAKKDEKEARRRYWSSRLPFRCVYASL